MKLLKPSINHLPDYVDALNKGWSPDNLRSEAAREQLLHISEDPQKFIIALDDPKARAGPVTLPDGTKTPRLPSFRRWIWDDGFCGHIGLRWQSGTDALPPTCSGHIGYGVVPWRQGEGLATAAVISLLPVAKSVGLNHLQITTSPENLASVRVIEKAGGVFVKSYRAEKVLGSHETLLFEIRLI